MAQGWLRLAHVVDCGQNIGGSGMARWLIISDAGTSSGVAHLWLWGGSSVDCGWDMGRYDAQLVIAQRGSIFDLCVGKQNYPKIVFPEKKKKTKIA